MHIIEFESKSGNKYIYDNNSGQIFCCNNESPDILVQEYYKKLGRYNDRIIKRIESNDVYNFLLKEGRGFRQMILEVTSQCNLRCKYCTYSEYYEHSHGYSNQFMSFDIAKKAVDYYIESCTQATKGNPIHEGYIGFYGGEPLLNFDLIEKVVQYIKDEYPDFKVNFNITTNGVLMNDQVIDFLVQNDFAVLVSLDGDEENNDRNRVTINNKGSFFSTMTNINLFREKNPDYIKFSISACYDPRTNINAVRSFFEKEKLDVTKFSAIETSNTNYYHQFTKEEFDNHLAAMDLLKEEMILNAKNNELRSDSFLYQALGVTYLEFSFHCMIGDTKNFLLPYTGTCVPGEKLYVTPDGKIHMCEKINPNFNIGDVEEGLDNSKLTQWINEYNEEISSNCINCEINKLCNLCFAKFADQNSFVYNGNLCVQMKERINIMLIDFINVLEEAPELIDNLTVNYYDYIMRTVKGGC